MWAGESKWKQEEHQLMGDINVTPMVDVMLVLLIIFMVTAPMLTQGVSVQLPDAKAPAMQENIEPLIISIKKDGTIYLNSHQISLQKLAPRVKAMRENKAKLPIYIRGDAKTPYEDIAKVMGLLAGAGIDKVGLVTEPQH